MATNIFYFSLICCYFSIFFQILIAVYMEFAGLSKQNQIYKYGNPCFLFFPDLLLFFHIFLNPY